MNGFHVPATVRMLESYDDGRDARHLTFAYEDPALAPRHAQPGQFFMLNVPGAGECAFTYSALPDAQGRFAALVRRVGSATAACLERPVGSRFGARGPFGQGWPLAQLAGRRVLVVGGGCGLAPLVALVRTLAAGNARFAVLYSARDEAARVLCRERAQWQADGVPLLEVLDAPGHIGPVPHITAALHLLGGQADVVVSCGPEAMMFAVAHAMARHGVAAEDILLSLERRMHCGTGHCGHCYIDGLYCCTDGPVLPWSRLRHPHPAQHAALPASP